MYNLYTYEKNKLMNDKIKNQEENEKKIKFKRNLELQKLSSNYDKRMNNFILNLCEHPIFIKNYTNKNSDLKLSNNKIYKNFSFGGFMTDKNRINLLNMQNKLNEEYEKSTKNKIDKPNDIRNNSEKKLFVQPKMRFKPRSELERIIEVMDLLGRNKRNKKVKKILEQLRQTDIKKLKQSKGFGKLKQIYKHNMKLNKSDIDKTNENSDSSKKEDTDENLDYTLEVNLYRKIRNISNRLKKQIKLRNKRLKDNDTGETLENKINFDKLKIRNKELIELFKDDEKTYFKGASQYAMIYNIRSNKSKDSRLKSAFSLSNSTGNINNYYSNNNLNILRNRNSKKLKRNDRPISMINIKTKLNKYYKDNSYKKLGIEFQSKKRTMDNVIKKEIEKSLLNQFYKKLDKKEYKNYFNKPFFLEKNAILIQKAKTIDSDLDNKLSYLKKIISLNSDSNEDIITQQTGTKENSVTKQKYKQIIIDGKKFKFDDIKNISDAIFTKCGYYNKKIIK